MVPFAMEGGGRLEGPSHNGACKWKEPSCGEETRGRLTWNNGVALGSAVATTIVNLDAPDPFAPCHSPSLPRNNIGAAIHLNRVQKGLDVSVTYIDICV